MIFLGAGLPLLPGVVLGGWGLRRGLFARLVAAAAILSGPAVLLAMSWEEIDMGLNPYPDNVFRAIIGGGALALVRHGGVGGSSATLGPWTRGRESGASPLERAGRRHGLSGRERPYRSGDVRA